MICHVCHEQAIGQCKKCNKFYCPQHGDVECVTCREATQKAPAAPPIDLRMPEYGGPARPAAGGGTVCFQCDGPASGACPLCGRFYCEAHQDRLWGVVRCTECKQKAVKRLKVACVVVPCLLAAWIALVVFLLLYISHH
jgi:hypothetical protein